MSLEIKGTLEIDQERGVIYFHADATGTSMLRLCRLPTPIPSPAETGEMLDVTHMYGASWPKEQKVDKITTQEQDEEAERFRQLIKRKSDEEGKKYDHR